VGLVAPAHASKELAEPEMAMGDVGAHSEPLTERERVAIVPLGIVRAHHGRNVPGEAERLDLATVCPQLAGQCQLSKII